MDKFKEPQTTGAVDYEKSYKNLMKNILAFYTELRYENIEMREEDALKVVNYFTGIGKKDLQKMQDDRLDYLKKEYERKHPEGVEAAMRR